MKPRFYLLTLCTVLLNACAHAPALDYSKVDARCAQKCQHEESECKVRFAEYPTLQYAHCKPEAEACLKDCNDPAKAAALALPSETATDGKTSIVERLKQLEELHKAGLITDQEYADKRREILQQL